ncbi:MAG: hypothetical protein A3J38_00435 [Gammaproteobacteria bacterium RIFCSPHIGHO2_12_FULL_45_9]|nr:MAG: hypothetical protein A3J38_00435 [Gammaproteobacteria bacterium RIFCSPHIGHO2_12_FULL_45_9]
MAHYFLVGLLLGWGAAIPIGPLNLEMIRRNITLGTACGMGLGFGACCADMTYLALLMTGALLLLTHPVVSQVVGVLSALILGWFGVSAFKKPPAVHAEQVSHVPIPPWQHGIQGYLMTLCNPFTILFWSSVSAQASEWATSTGLATVWIGVGVLAGTVSWVLSLNSVLHVTRHLLSKKAMLYLNYVGGVILLGFAVYGLWHALTA